MTVPTRTAAHLRPAWSTGTEPNALAALPRGVLGRVGGEVLRRTNGAQQREIAGLLAERGLPAAGAHVVEVGPGPGLLTARLAAGGTQVTAVDPSETMRAMAVRALARPIARGLVSVLDGTAERTGLPDRCADVVVSVNTVAIWPDLDAGVAELHRVLRPGATLVLSWHGGTTPSRTSRALTLPAHQLDRIETAVAARFSDVRRMDTRRCTVFVATEATRRIGDASAPRDPDDAR